MTNTNTHTHLLSPNHRYFETGFQAYIDDLAPFGYVRFENDTSTCVDTRSGHGSHVSATAGGNAGVPAVAYALLGGNETASLGSMSGMVRGVA